MKPVVGAFLFWLCLVSPVGIAAAKPSTPSLLNVSYDPTREFYQDINASFLAHWEQQTGIRVKLEQSHGGSGKQARSVIDGLEADVVTLAVASDIDALAARGLLPMDWQSRLPHASCAYTSTIVLLVRKGNPKSIHDWADLAKQNVSVITPNPKTSGGARWNYLAIWGYALAQGGDEQSARDLLGRIFKNVPLLDTGARGSTTTFVERGIGDVLVAWENEALLVSRRLKPGAFEIIIPKRSILAQPPVAWVDRNVAKHGTAELARAYLEFLYTEEGQRLAGKHFYRPVQPEIAAQFADQFPQLELFTIDELAGGWQKAQQVHFADGGTFDQIYQGPR